MTLAVPVASTYTSWTRFLLHSLLHWPPALSVVEVCFLSINNSSRWDRMRQETKELVEWTEISRSINKNTKTEGGVCRTPWWGHWEIVGTAVNVQVWSPAGLCSTVLPTLWSIDRKRYHLLPIFLLARHFAELLKCFVSFNSHNHSLRWVLHSYCPHITNEETELPRG